MNKKYLSIFLIALLFSSCGENKNSKNDVYENTIKGKKAELKKIGQFVIQEDSTAFIGRFRNVKFREGKLVLADMFNPALFFIDINGNIVKKFKFEKGEGPGEVNEIGNFEIMNGRIYISDMGNLRWSVFDTTGRFIKSEKPFYDPRSKTQGLYYENASITESYAGQIYVSIIEVKYIRDLQQNKSKSIAILDSTLIIKKVFGFMDDIYSKLRIYISTATMTVDSKGFIYYSQKPTYSIYKYDSSGNFVKVFGVKGKFKVINENLIANQPYSQIDRIAKKYSTSSALFSSPKGYILHLFVDLTDKFFDTGSLPDRINYLKVYDTDGNYISSDIKLDGVLITVDNEGKLYVYESDEPGNRVIGIYELKVIKD